MIALGANERAVHRPANAVGVLTLDRELGSVYAYDNSFAGAPSSGDYDWDSRYKYDEYNKKNPTFKTQAL
ncbi:hypothetical protein IID24_00240 [Patescibacteria group bacterium]|nr:hypothetical protein [Patescibacteria group bacterium]